MKIKVCNQISRVRVGLGLVLVLFISVSVTPTTLPIIFLTCVELYRYCALILHVSQFLYYEILVRIPTVSLVSDCSGVVMGPTGGRPERPLLNYVV